MKERDKMMGGGAADIDVDSLLQLGRDGWQFLSYNTNPTSGYLFRDGRQGRPGLEILYWRGGERNEPQFVIDAATGNIGIGAASPTDKLTIRGGGLSFQQTGQDQPEMGIDYDAASQSLKIRARKGNSTTLSDDLLTIKKDGEITAKGNINATGIINATGKINATGGLAVTGNLTAQSINATERITAGTEVVAGDSKMTGDTVSAQILTARTQVNVGNSKLTGDTVTAQNLRAGAEVSVDTTKLAAEGVSGKTLTATVEIKTAKIQGTGTGGNLTLSTGQGQLTLQGGRVVLGSELGKEIVVLSNIVLDANKKILLKGSDENQGIRNGLSIFAVDGPLVFGDGGGVLGSRYLFNGVIKQVMGLAWTQKGDIGIGTTTPDGMLEIVSRDDRQPDSIIKFGSKNSDAHHLSSARDMVFNSVKGEFFFRKLTTFDDIGSFGVAPIDPIRSSLMYIDPSGNVKIKGQLTQGSSREFKENISELTADEAIAALQELNPVRYDYKDARAFRQNLGFIAEEMPASLASEDRKSISPLEVIPVLTRVVKEQQRTISALQKTVRALQAEQS